MEMEGDLMLLPGQRFCPMEDELLMYYLYPKVNGMNVPGNGSVICEMDLYGQDPWKIWDRFQATKANDLRRNKDLYFFTRNTKKNSRTSRTIRTGGSWKGQTSGEEIFLLDHNHDPTSTRLGSKKSYTYRNANSVHNGRWTMYEFELDESHLLQGKKNDYVLCLLRKPLEKKRKRPEEEDVPEVIELMPQNKTCCRLPCSASDNVQQADEPLVAFYGQNSSACEMFDPQDLLATIGDGPDQAFDSFSEESDDQTARCLAAADQFLMTDCDDPNIQIFYNQVEAFAQSIITGDDPSFQFPG